MTSKKTPSSRFHATRQGGRYLAPCNVERSDEQDDERQMDDARPIPNHDGADMKGDAIIAAAKAAYKAGLCVVPPLEDGTKAPIVPWKALQGERPDAERMRHWFANGRRRQGIGAVTGAISGNLELFEFDDMDTYEVFKDTGESIGLGDVIERIEAGYLERTPGGGIHWLYRCEELRRNTKLARRLKRPEEMKDAKDKYQVLIETKGEGGYVVLAPSGGKVHETGQPYMLLRGGFDSIATITPEERQALWSLAEAFDQLPKVEYVPPDHQPSDADGERPGDQFNVNGPSWQELLTGWTLVYRRGETEYWRRPGKDHGISATINGPGITPDRLYVFTSSTAFDPERSYTKFQAYTVLHHNGDFAAAARQLKQEGYGSGGSASFVYTSTDQDDRPVSTDDFRAYMPEHRYIFRPNGEVWPASSVNARIPPIPTGEVDEKGKEKRISASTWLDRHAPVEQMTWAPGEGELVEGRLISHGGWFDHPGATVYNLYKPPVCRPGNPDLADPWIDHVHKVYPDDAEHIINWLAHRVQAPGEKINHALVLGGSQGVGKDTLLEPVKHAVGPWNFQEVSPAHLMGRFNGFVESVILRLSEARDLGDVDRYAFYEAMKIYTASPPDVLRVDKKNRSEYSVVNVCSVIITTNYLTGGIYLPPDDRRHYVAWSELASNELDEDYWDTLYGWYENGGVNHVAAYLASLDLSTFNAKAPPPKTAAFWSIVDANQAPEDGELADILDQLNNPAAVSITQIVQRAGDDLRDWLKDRRNSRKIPHRLEAVGYVRVRNDDAKDGLWVVKGKRQAIYAKKDLDIRDRIVAAREIVDTGYP